MVTKKIRTEYMKKFKDPRWETFSKCYEDSLRYRLTRRVMEHSHRPWFWDSWDGSDSSGRSTPRLSRNKILPLSLPPPGPAPEVKHGSPEPESGPEAPPLHGGAGSGEVDGPAPSSDAVIENGLTKVSGGSAVPTDPSAGVSSDSAADTGPADYTSSNSEDTKPAAKWRHRRRANRSQPEPRNLGSDRKPQRAKSQPPISRKENQSRLDWTERQMESGRTGNQNQSYGGSARCEVRAERRRARSADLEKGRRSQLAVVDERWTTEYMRCFSARLR